MFDQEKRKKIDDHSSLTVTIPKNRYVRQSRSLMHVTIWQAQFMISEKPSSTSNNLGIIIMCSREKVSSGSGLSTLSPYVLFYGVHANAGIT